MLRVIDDARVGKAAFKRVPASGAPGASADNRQRLLWITPIGSASGPRVEGLFLVVDVSQ
jgi:hypothetical protein